MDDNLILKYKYSELDTKSIHSICAHQDADKLIKMSFRGAYLDSKDENNISPLMICAFTGNIRTLNILLSKEIHVNSQDYNGNYALSIAILNNNVEAVNILINKTNKDLLNKKNQNLLYYLVDYCEFDLFKSNFRNYNLEHKDIDNNNILEFAVKEYVNIERVKYIINSLFYSNKIFLLEKLLFYLINCEEIDNDTFDAISFEETYHFDIFKFILLKIINRYDFKTSDKDGNNLILLSVINRRESIFIFLLDCIFNIKDNIIEIKDILYYKNNSQKNIFKLFFDFNLEWEKLIHLKKNIILDN